MTLLIALMLAAATPPSTEDTQVVHLKDAKFTPAKGMPQGVFGSPIGVDPNTKGGTGYAKLTSGTKLGEHTHSFAEYSTFLAGNGTLTIDDKSYELAAGDYFIIAPKTRHSLTCKEGADCVVLTRRAGPADYNFTKTASK